MTFTGRELQIALLVSEGNATSKIVAYLGVSPRTVKGHILHIYQKLNIHSRVELAMWMHTQWFNGT